MKKVRASGLRHTIVRPAWFGYNAPNQHRLLMLQGDKPLAGNPSKRAIARPQIATVLARNLSSQAALGKTFELHGEKAQSKRISIRFSLRLKQMRSAR